MHVRRFHSSVFGPSLRPQSATLAILFTRLFFLLGLLFIMLTAQPAQAQTFTVLYTFSGGSDGASPLAGLTIDAAGNFYGTTFGTEDNGGCDQGLCGTVFKLWKTSIGWRHKTLYNFGGTPDGANPWGTVAIARNGTLYGTTYDGGILGGCFEGFAFGCGTVYQLIPPPAIPGIALTPWNETLIFSFTGGSDGGRPEGDLTFDDAGNLYGTTTEGGSCSLGRCGVVYELVPSGQGATESVLYVFQANGDGSYPVGGVVFDKAGNLYGVTNYGDQSKYLHGTVYELSLSGSGWTQRVLYGFTGGNDGDNPWGGLMISPSGSLYGTTSSSGAGGGGTVFGLTSFNGSWKFNIIHSFSEFEGKQPWDKLAMDAAGNLYGTTRYGGAYGNGTVFKLTRSKAGWTYTSLHDFTGGSDGNYPYGSPVLDKNGNIYGTTSAGGANGYGVVFQITPQ